MEGEIMSLIPEFEFGLWNAWILVLLFNLIVNGLGKIFERRFSYKGIKPDRPTFTGKEERLTLVLMGAVIASFVYSVFLPLKLGTVWFYAGLSIYLLGMVFLIIAQYDYVSAPEDKLLTGGVYRISRNPMWFGFFLILFGICVACVSWIYLLCSVIFIILQHILLVPEERWCLEKYGDAYREYMNSTPKWIGIPKSKKTD
jgi:protein-S-isoprenylcysteine O-methyltransferase Ste14